LKRIADVLLNPGAASAAPLLEAHKKRATWDMKSQYVSTSGAHAIVPPRAVLVMFVALAQV
jgi:hypothetical protein